MFNLVDQTSIRNELVTNNNQQHRAGQMDGGSMFLPRSEPRLHQRSHHLCARKETFQIILESSNQVQGGFPPINLSSGHLPREGLFQLPLATQR